MIAEAPRGSHVPGRSAAGFAAHAGFVSGVGTLRPRHAVGTGARDEASARTGHRRTPRPASIIDRRSSIEIPL